MSNQGNQTQRPKWQVCILIGLIGVGLGAIIGATTGMWWMMGVLGGVFGGFSPTIARRTG